MEAVKYLKRYVGGAPTVHNNAMLCFSSVFCRDCRDRCRGRVHFTVETVGTEIF